MEIPKDLSINLESKNAIKAEKILVVANKIDSYRNPHSKPGGQGQFARISQGTAWIEKPYVFGPKKVT